MEITVTLKNYSKEFIKDVAAYDCVSSPYIYLKLADGTEIYLNPNEIISFSVDHLITDEIGDENPAEDAE